MSLETRLSTRLKGLYRLNRRLLNQIEHEPNGKERQHRIDERAAVAIAIGLFRDHPELVYAKLQAREDSLAAERVRQAEQAAKNTSVTPLVN